MTEEYLKNRVNDQIKWYSDKATSNKLLHHWTKAAVIIFSAAFPLIAGLDFNNSSKNLLLGLLGTLTAILSVVLGLLKFKEKWSEYRTTSETLKHEKLLFVKKTGPTDNADEPFKILVTRVENFISKEHSAWSQYINKEN